MESIREKVIDAITIVTGKKSVDLSQMIDDNLMGTKMNLTPLELIYLFEKLEIDFSVKFTVEDLDNKDFYTINAITTRICDYASV